MTRDATELFAEAMGLPESQRGELAVQLIESLDPITDEDGDSSWGAEIQQRLEEIHRGSVQPVPWAEARRMILEDADGAGAA